MIEFYLLTVSHAQRASGKHDCASAFCPGDNNPLPGSKGEPLEGATSTRSWKIVVRVYDALVSGTYVDMIDAPSDRLAASTVSTLDQEI